MYETRAERACRCSGTECILEAGEVMILVYLGFVPASFTPRENHYLARGRLIHAILPPVAAISLCTRRRRPRPMNGHMERITLVVQRRLRS